ncbi:peptide transport system permease protein SapC [Vibrio astriarenae]|nr:peptide transport system permease protein SapC [Vibrio sp. C7]
MLSNSVYQEEQIPTQFERFWRSFRNNNLAMFSLWCLGLITVITIFASCLRHTIRKLNQDISFCLHHGTQKERLTTF